MLRRFLRLLPALLTWALVCIMFWGWIFSILTDAPASKKLIVYIDAPLKNTRELAGRLEANFPRSQIRFIEIRSFSYSMMGDSPAADGDIFILPSDSAEANKHASNKRGSCVCGVFLEFVDEVIKKVPHIFHLSFWD